MYSFDKKELYYGYSLKMKNNLKQFTENLRSLHMSNEINFNARKKN